MIIDMEQLLTATAGTLFDGGSGVAEYSAAADQYDLKATTYGGNPAVGEPLKAYFMCLADVNNATNGYLIEIVAKDLNDQSNTGEVILLSKTVLLADLTLANGVQEIGSLLGLAIAITNQYLVAKVTTISGGTAPTTGLMKIWLSKAIDQAPNNPAMQL